MSFAFAPLLDLSYDGGRTDQRCHSDYAGGEWRHGYTPSDRSLHPPEYRIYWAVYDYLDDFPDGVHYHVGTSREAIDFNYVHWSVFGGYANALRPEQVEGDGNINNWTVTFDVADADVRGTEEATFTIQLAGAKAASGNTDVYNASQPYANIPYNVVINGQALETWTIPYVGVFFSFFLFLPMELKTNHADKCFQILSVVVLCCSERGELLPPSQQVDVPHQLPQHQQRQQ